MAGAMEGGCSGEGAPWYMVVDAAGGENYARRQHMWREAETARGWGHDARDAAGSAEGEARSRSKAEVSAARQRNHALELADEMAHLRVEALAAVPDSATRAALKHERRVALISGDFHHVRAVESQRAANKERLWARFAAGARAAEEARAEGRGPPLALEVLAHLGSLLSGQAARLVGQSQVSEMAAARAGAAAADGGGNADGGQGAADAADAAADTGTGERARRRSTALVAFTCASAAPCLFVLNGGRTVVHEDAPATRPRWGAARFPSAARPVARRELSRESRALGRLMEMTATAASEGRFALLALLRHALALCRAAGGSPQSGARLAAVVGAALRGRRSEEERLTELLELDDEDDGGGGGGGGFGLGERELWDELEEEGVLLGLGGSSADGAPVLAADCATAAVAVDDDNVQPLARQVIAQLLSRSRTHGCFYYELHSHQHENQWVAGFMVAAGVAAAPDDSATPAARSARGSARGSGAGPRSAFHAPPGDEGPRAVGVTSEGRAVWDGKEHAIAGCDGHLSMAAVVGFVLDLHAGRVELHTDGERRGVVLGLGAASFPPSVQRRQSEFLRRRPLAAAVALLGRRKAVAPAPGSAPRSPRGLRLADSGAGAGAGTKADGHHALVRPKLSVNVGLQRLSHLPAGCVPLAVYGPSGQSRDDGGDDPAAARGDEGGTDGGGVNPMSFSRFRPAAARRASGRRASTIARGGGDAPAAAAAAAVAMDPDAAERRARFDAAWRQVTSWHRSWSNFPPQSVRIRLAVLTLQRAARRYNARKRRKRMLAAFQRAAIRIQRGFRRWHQRYAARMTGPAVTIQSLARGRSARRVFAVCRERNLKYHHASSAATLVQSRWRGVRGRREAAARARELCDQLDYAHHVVCLVQRLWRAKRMKSAQGGIARGLNNRAAISSILRVEGLLRSVRMKRESILLRRLRHRQEASQAAARAGGAGGGAASLGVEGNELAAQEEASPEGGTPEHET